MFILQALFKYKLLEHSLWIKLKALGTSIEPVFKYNECVYTYKTYEDKFFR